MELATEMQVMLAVDRLLSELAPTDAIRIAEWARDRAQARDQADSPKAKLDGLIDQWIAVMPELIATITRAPEAADPADLVLPDLQCGCAACEAHRARARANPECAA